jgi:hypothetical protein
VSLAAAATREAQIDRLFARWTGPGRPGAAVAVAERGAVALRRYLTDRTRHLGFRRV